MHRDGNFEEALIQYLFRAYVSFEKLEVPTNDSEKFTNNEVLFKLMRQIYVCFKLQPSVL